MIYVNQLKDKALRILLKEAFSYIDEGMYREYTVLAKDNAKMQNIRHPDKVLFFSYNGQTFPRHTPTGASVLTVHVHAPPLHYSLIATMKKITALRENAGYTSIKNYFSAVLAHSYNNMVLDACLPTLLLSKLQAMLTPEEYAMIDFGGTVTADPVSQKKYQDPETTQANLHMLQNHYAKAIIKLKNLLMERFLLQS